MQASERSAADVSLELPSALAPGWTADGAQLAEWTPHYVNPSATAQRAYAGPGGTVGVYVAYYRAQNAERKLVNSLNGLVSHNERQWLVTANGTVTVDAAGTPVTLRTARLTGPQAGTVAARPQLAARQVYWVDGRFVASDLQAKMAGAASRVRGHGDDGAVLVLYAHDVTPQAAQALLDAFVRDNFATLAAWLQRTHDAR
jgi:EpsI family protein